FRSDLPPKRADRKTHDVRIVWPAEIGPQVTVALHRNRVQDRDFHLAEVLLADLYLDNFPALPGVIQNWLARGRFDWLPLLRRGLRNDIDRQPMGLGRADVVVELHLDVTLGADHRILWAREVTPNSTGLHLPCADIANCVSEDLDLRVCLVRRIPISRGCVGLK